MVAQISTSAKQEQTLRLIGKATFKANGYILYRVASGEKQYDISIIHGKVTGCKETATGETCRGFHFRHSCKHAEYVSQLEAERSPVAAKVQEAAGIRDALKPSDKGTLSSNRGFSLMAV